MLREESQRQLSPSNSQSGHAHPVHPSSQSRSCASPPSTENLGPYWSPLLMLQPHLPPAGCRPQAQEWSWELAQNRDSMWGGHAPFQRHCSPTPALEEVPRLCLGSCCLSALPVSLPPSLSIPPHPVPSQGPPYLCHSPRLCLSSTFLLLSTHCFSLLVPLAIPLRVSEGGD